jgi:signal transduction histidine kinase
MNSTKAGNTHAGGHVSCEHCASLTEQTIGTAGSARREGDDPARRPQLLHDINHLLGLIVQLVSIVGLDEGLGPDSRARVGQITNQVRWLEQLVGAYHDASGDPTAQRRAEGPRGEPAWAEAVRVYPVQVNRVARTVVHALDLAASTCLSFNATTSWAYVDPLALWRAIRNLVDNAVRIAGPAGRVQVWVESDARWTVVRVDDDGPGFGAGAGVPPHLGLAMVREFVAQSGGRLEIGTSPLGGAGVRMFMPTAPPAESASSIRADEDEAAAV